MSIQKAIFLESNPSVKTCPSAHLPEYAFIGRSNVGKSSLINAITNQKNLAKTSSTPGKTQLINHFLINESWYLVDLPGYGWARVSKKKRTAFEGLITEYLLDRKNLVLTFVLIDIRHDPQPIDLEFFVWLGENEIPFAIVYTKSDKLTANQAIESLEKYDSILRTGWSALPPQFVTSSLKNEGTEAVIGHIEKYNELLEKEFANIKPQKIDKEAISRKEQAKQKAKEKEEKRKKVEQEKLKTEKQNKDVEVVVIETNFSKKKKTVSQHTKPFAKDTKQYKSKKKTFPDKPRDKSRGKPRGKKG